MFRSILPLLLAVLSGLLLVAAFPPFDQTWLIWIALIPALLGVHLGPPPAPFPPLTWRSLRARAAWREWTHPDFWRPHLPGYLLGLVSFGGLFWWIGEVTILGTVLLVLYVALYPAIWLSYARRRWPRGLPFTSTGSLLLGIELASLWVLGEWVRGWLFTGFGWDGLGVALHQNLPLLQGARLGGVLFLTWIVALVNVVGAVTLVRLAEEARGRQKLRAHLDFCVVMLGIALLFVFGWHQLWKRHPGVEPRHLRYALIQPNVPQELDDAFPPAESLRRHLDLTEKAALLHPDLVVWPESPVGIDVVLDRRFHDAIFDLLANADWSLVAGSLHIVDGKVFNSALLFDPYDGGLHIYDKNRLVPFGEYAPLARWLPFMRALVPFQIDFSPGLRPALLTLDNGVRLLPLICYEDTLAGYARQGAKLDPDLLLNITNDGWFHASPGAAQHLAQAVFRAVELDRPLLRCGNTGITAVVAPSGRVLSQLEAGKGNVSVAGLLSGEAAWYPAEPTLYARYGNWIVAVSVAVVACGLANRRLKRRRDRAPGPT